MVQKPISIVLVLVLLGFTCPAFAGDYVNTNLHVRLFPLAASAPPGLATRAALLPGLAFGLPQAGQTAVSSGQAPQTKPANSSRGWSQKGKILTGIGLGLMATGFAGEMTYRFSRGTGCISNPVACKSGPGSGLNVFGIVALASGFALTIVGLTRHGD